MTKKERENLFIDIYKANQNFIDKWTFTAALGSIPLAIAFVETVQMMCCFGKFMFMLVNACAVLVVIAHIIGAICGKKQCDIMLGNEENADGYGHVQRICNWVVNVAFCVMVIGYLVIMGVLVYGG